MDLFQQPVNSSENLLPRDGVVNYFGRIMDKPTADTLFQRLLDTIEWKNDQAIIYGKTIITKRKVAWYGSAPFAYTYSRIIRHALPWTAELLDLKNLVEKKSGETYNSCLLNLYHNGDEGMAWHSDAEKELKKNGAIASVSLGATRPFAFKHKQTDEKLTILLEHGSLLVMKDKTQTHWLHRLPPTKKVKNPRINLTFRTIGQGNEGQLSSLQDE